MAAIDGTDLVVTVVERWIEGVKRHSRGTIDIVGTATYTTGGIALVSGSTPAVKRFGMDRQLDVLIIQGSQVDSDPGTSSTTNYVYGYNPTLKTLALYQSAGDGDVLDQADTSEVPGPRRLNFYAIGW